MNTMIYLIKYSELVVLVTIFSCLVELPATKRPKGISLGNKNNTITQALGRLVRMLGYLDIYLYHNYYLFVILHASINDPISQITAKPWNISPLIQRFPDKVVSAVMNTICQHFTDHNNLQ